MGFPSHFFSSFHQGWFWQAVVHYIEAWKKWPGLCWWRILASKNNGKGKERLVCLDDCIGTSFFWWGVICIGQNHFCWDAFLLEDFSAIDEFTTIYCSFLRDFFLLPKISGNFFSNRRNKSPFPIGPYFFCGFEDVSGETMVKCIPVHSGKRYFLVNHLHLYDICGICECICRC